MHSKDWTTALEQSLEDFRLSRSERSAIKQLVSDNVRTENEIAVVRAIAFDVARNKLQSNLNESSAILQWLEDFAKVLESCRPRSQSIDSHAVFSTQEDCARYLQGLISTARKSIDVCVFTITDDRVTSALIEAHKRKVNLRVVSDDEKASDRGSDLYQLKQAGIEVKTDRDPNHMHHKFAIFDGKRLMNGSYNWTRSAALRNEENFVVTDDTRLVREFTSHFERLWHLFD